ncbi:hypothetical protein ZWY2020_005583 [Hordeum vulgare]|nr:hypothetical protein ZWY2020_005583 [Hordeum vulgare]
MATATLTTPGSTSIWIVDLIREAAIKRARREERIANIACQAMKAARLHEKNEVLMELVAVVDLDGAALLNLGWLTLLLAHQEQYVKMERARTTR